MTNFPRITTSNNSIQWNCSYPSIGNEYPIVINQKQDEFSAAFPPNCTGGDLLSEGLQQHIELGNFYRQYLVNELHFLPEELNKTLVHFYATNVRRAQQSAEAFIDGLYPQTLGSEIKNDVIDIDVCNDDGCNLAPPFEICDEVAQQWTNFLQSKKTMERFWGSRTFFNSISQELGVIMTLENWNYIVDYVIVKWCAQKFDESWLTDAVFNHALGDHAYLMTEFYRSTNGAAGSVLMREVMNNIENNVNGPENAKFVLYGAHDSSLMSLLGVLGVYLNETCPYRSHLAVELWKGEKTMIRFGMNGEEVPISFMHNETLVGFEEFKKKLDQAIGNHCMFPDNFIQFA